MNKKGIRSGASFKAQYKIYSLRQSFAKNRLRRLERHIKAHPEDTVAKKCLANSNYLVYRRRKPRHKGINSGIPIFDKRTQKITERRRVEFDLFPNKPEPAITVAEQMYNLGIITRIPKKYVKQNARVSS